MARNDPQRLERLRLELTGNVIESAPNERQRARLRGLQFRVDMERKRSNSPLAATIRISEMMCHSLADLHRSMVTPLVAEAETMENVIQSAAVLHFRKATDQD